MFAGIEGYALIISAISAQAEGARGAEVRFGHDGKYRAYMVQPEGDGPFPALVVIHEWWGLNDNIRQQADRLAEAGYVALAVDLFGQSTTDPQEAQQMVRKLDQKGATAEMLYAAGYLRSQPYVRHDRVGSIGWCFGGAQSLNLAISDPNLAAAVIYYGKPVTEVSSLARIHAAVLGIYGEADESIPMRQVKEFRRELTQARVNAEFHTYPEAGHAFANPSRGEAYKPEAARDAWEKTIAFLEKHLKR